MAELILEIVEGPEAGRQINVDQTLEIGRDPSVQVAVQDAEVSRRHARLAVQNGQVVVDDLGSTNGTYVNDQPIQGPRALQPGDRVRVGLTVLLLRDAAQVAHQPSAIQPVPQLTVVGHEILRPASPAELGNPVAEASQSAPQFMSEESEPAFVPREVVDDVEARTEYERIARLVDTRVKSQTTRAVIALLSAAALAVLLVFGLK